MSPRDKLLAALRNLRQAAEAATERRWRREIPDARHRMPSRRTRYAEQRRREIFTEEWDKRAAQARWIQRKLDRLPSAEGGNDKGVV